MNRILPAVLVILFFSCQAVKNENQGNSESTASSGNAGIDFVEDMHDFGVLKAGEILAFGFEFKNNGERKLYIENAVSDCACLKVRYSESAVNPGQAGWLEVEFDSSGLYGKQLKTVQIYTGVKEPKYLTIFAEVQNEQIEFKY